MAILAVGLLATVVIASKPLVEKTTALRAVFAALAIILSASVATLSSLNSYKSGQVDLIRNQRTLAQLQQLHWRVNNDVLSNPKLCDREDIENLNKVNSW